MATNPPVGDVTTIWPTASGLFLGNANGPLSTAPPMILRQPAQGTPAAPTTTAPTTVKLPQDVQMGGVGPGAAERPMQSLVLAQLKAEKIQAENHILELPNEGFVVLQEESLTAATKELQCRKPAGQTLDQALSRHKIAQMAKLAMAPRSVGQHDARNRDSASSQAYASRKVPCPGKETPTQRGRGGFCIHFQGGLVPLAECISHPQPWPANGQDTHTHGEERIVPSIAHATPGQAPSSLTSVAPRLA